MYAEISAAIASTKTALDIAKAAHELSNFNELVAALSEVNAKLMQATAVALASQEKQSELTDEIAILKDKIRKNEDWEAQMQRYQLIQFPTGALVYAVKPGMEQGQPTHYLCASCVDKRQKSTLQPHARSLRCNVCSLYFQMHSRQDTNPSSGGGPQSWMGR